MKRVLIPSQYPDPGQPAGSHFGRAAWYLFLDENGTLQDAIPGGPETGHGLIFKLVGKEAMPEAIVVHHVGDHLVKIAEHWKVKIMHMGGRITASEAAKDYFKGQLKPLFD